MRPATPSDFNRLYETHLKHLRLKGQQPKTIEAYARAIRRIGASRTIASRISPKHSSSSTSPISWRPTPGVP